MKFVVTFNQSQATLLRRSLFLLGSETVICTVLSSSSSTFIHTWFSAVCVTYIFHGNNLFHLYQQNKRKAKRGTSYRLAIVAKGFLKLSNLPMLVKQKNLPLLGNLGCWQIC